MMNDDIIRTAYLYIVLKLRLPQVSIELYPGGTLTQK